MIARPTAVLVFLLALALLIVARGSATAGTEVRPDLVSLPADDLRIEYQGATKLLRFTTTAANLGSGALMIVAKGVAAPNERADGTSVVAYQRVFDETGGFTDYNIGSLIWHDDHGHWHFKQYARYLLTDESAPGASGVESEKTSFCLLDTDRLKPRLKGASKFPVFTQCGSDEQGISPGWADSYPYYLPGQAIDITGLSDGRYLLTIVIDPGHKILEADAGSNSGEDPNNTSQVTIEITGDNVRVVDDDGGKGQGGGRGRGGGPPNR